MCQNSDMDFSKRSARLVIAGAALVGVAAGGLGVAALTSSDESTPVRVVRSAEVVVAPSTAPVTAPATVAPVTEAPAPEPEPGQEITPPPMPAEGQAVVPTPGPYGPVYPDGYVDPNIPTPTVDTTPPAPRPVGN